ncbi:hypothetical protein AWJ19_03175 [Paenibacillus sp. DMB5]|nr:hypothetical protein AWJ19_03175 [Paenibacillus sp. DMB5]
MFFFFAETAQFRRGLVCRVTTGSSTDKMVVVQHVSVSDGETTLWCYENKPVTRRINHKGISVIDFDPACVTSPFSPRFLEITDELPLQNDGWGARYRREALKSQAQAAADRENEIRKIHLSSNHRSSIRSGA